MITRLGLLALLLPPVLALSGAARAQDVGDAANGRRLAEAWCANCHALDSSRQATATGAPAFSAIAADKAITATALQVFLRTPHKRMPDLNLSNGEIADLIAFVLGPRGN